MQRRWKSLAGLGHGATGWPLRLLHGAGGFALNSLLQKKGKSTKHWILFLIPCMIQKQNALYLSWQKSVGVIWGLFQPCGAQNALIAASSLPFFHVWKWDKQMTQTCSCLHLECDSKVGKNAKKAQLILYFSWELHVHSLLCLSTALAVMLSCILKWIHWDWNHQTLEMFLLDP